jgi:hypothetical protein
MTGGRGATVPDRGRQSGVARTRLARQPPEGSGSELRARSLRSGPRPAGRSARRCSSAAAGRGAAVAAPPVGRPRCRRGPVDGNAGGHGARAAVPATPAEVTAAPAIAGSGGPTRPARPQRPTDTDERGCVTDPFRHAVSHLAARGGGGWRSPGAECPDRPTSPRAGNPCPTDRCRPWTETTPWRARSPRAATGGGGLAAPPRPLPPPFLRRAGDVVGAELQRLEDRAAACATSRRRCERLRRQRLRLDAVPVAGSAYGVADQATCELCADPGLDLGARGNMPTRASGARPSSGAPRARSSAPRGRR